MENAIDISLKASGFKYRKKSLASNFFEMV
jgi:hypothetical protein